MICTLFTEQTNKKYLSCVTIINLKNLFMDDKGEASRKLVEKVIDTPLNTEVEEQIERILYERSDNDQIYRNGYQQRDFTI